MFLTVLNSELKKLKRSPIWFILLILPLIPSFIGTFNYLQNIAILQDGWYSLWTQHTLFTCYFFMPPMLASFCACLLRMEHHGTNWNLILSMPIPRRYILFSKLAIMSILIMISQLWIGVLFILCGKLSNIPNPIPPELISWLLCGALGCISIASIQILISLVFKSFALPVSIAFIGGIFGLAIHSKGFGLFYPYALMCLGMRANDPGGPMSCSPSSFIVSNLVFIIFPSVISVLYLSFKNISTE